MLQDILSDAEEKFEASFDHFKAELAVIRSSQTSPALVEDILVNAYNATFPLKELAAISVPEPNLILIEPWDKSIIENIQVGLQQAPLGIQPIVEGQLIRLPVPPLSKERRQEMITKVSTLTEEAKIAVRNVRQQKMKSLDGLLDEAKISEDERDRHRKQIQKLVDECNQNIEEAQRQKTKTLAELS